MKSLVLLIGALMLVAAPLHAYVAPGSIQKAPRLAEPGNKGAPVVGGGLESGITGDVIPLTSPVSHPGRLDTDGDENPTRPVPEPGTLAMATMGLVAVGAALGNRRSR